MARVDQVDVSRSVQRHRLGVECSEENEAHISFVVCLHGVGAVDIAVGEAGGTVRPGAVRRNDRRVEDAQRDPDGRNDHDGGAWRPVACGAGGMDDRQIPHDGDGNQRVDGHVRSDVDIL